MLAERRQEVGAWVGFSVAGRLRSATEKPGGCGGGCRRPASRGPLAGGRDGVAKRLGPLPVWVARSLAVFGQRMSDRVADGGGIGAGGRMPLAGRGFWRLLILDGHSGLF